MNRNICWYQNECIASMNKAHDASTDGETHPHFKAFTDLLDQCEKGKLLDLGTGTARISQYCQGFDFYGADLPHIISGCAMRNYPQYFYKSVDLIEDNLGWIRKFDVILLNGVIDIMQNGLYILERVLTHANKYVIVHRQEITESGQTKFTVNPSYSSKTHHSIINRKDFTDMVERMNFEIVCENSPQFANWENNGSSFLLKNKTKDLSKYDLPSLRQLRNRIQQANPLKVVVGGGELMYDASWIVTNYEELDIENEDDFKFLFGDKKADNILSSHVHEHLEYPDKANTNLYKYLKEGGKLRIAVPDGNHPNEDYINHVKPGGIGAGADDHKRLWNYESLLDSCVNAGFKADGIEYWFDGNFTKKDWSITDGFVGRSAEYDERNINGELNYTSLIIDCTK